MPQPKGKTTTALTKDQKHIKLLIAKIRELENRISAGGRVMKDQDDRIMSLKNHLESRSGMIDFCRKHIDELSAIIEKKEHELKELKNPPVKEFNPCSVCRQECPFKKLDPDRRSRLCLYADDLKEKYNEAIKGSNNPAYIEGNRHLYSWLTKPVELPEEHEEWLISLSSYLRQNSN